MPETTTIGGRPVWVWLPPDYHTRSARRPVIYMQDGQNLFSPAYAFRGQPWGIDRALVEHAQRSGRPAPIVVGIGNTPLRRRDYAPNSIEALLPSSVANRIEMENGGVSLGDAYLRMIVQTLKPMIDAQYRTLPGPRDTILMGSSRGGMIALYGLCEYPDVFGRAASLSTHWLLLPAPAPPVDPKLETPAIIDALSIYFRQKLPRAGAHKIWMDHGTINLDAYYPPYQSAINQVFLAQAWRRGRDFEARVYDGADHNEAAWRARLADPLAFLL